MVKQKINPDKVAPPAGPYTNMIKVDDAKSFIFLSGVSASNEKGETVGCGDILAQVKQIVKNITLELEAVGAKPENVVMTTTYVLGDYMEEIMTSGALDVLFETFDHPTDSLVGVKSLAGMNYGALVEITAIAII